MFSAVLPMLCVFILGCSIHFILNFKIEISIFLAVCSITILIYVSAMIHILTVGVYFIYALIIFSVIYMIFYLLKNRKRFREIMVGVFTPGVIILILAYVAYFIVTRDKVLAYRDEATSWVIEIKYMYTVGAFKDFGSHPNILAFFSLFSTRIAGYSEPIIFLSRWLFVWCCLILPISSLGWNDWLKAFIFAVGSYCIISIINSDVVYYMDMPLGVLAGSLCAIWSKEKINNKDYIWAYPGVFILFLIKDEIGLAIGGLVLIYLTFANIIRYYRFEDKQRKPSIKKISLNLGLFAVFTFALVKSIRLHKYFSGIILNIPTLFLVSGIILLSIIVIGVFIYRAKIKALLKKCNTKILIGIVLIIAAVIFYKVISILYSSFGIDKQKMFVEGISTIYRKGYFGKHAYLLIAYFIIFIILIGRTFIEKKSAKWFILQGLMISFMIIVYSFVLLLGYMFEKNAYNYEFLQLQRYYGPIFILAALWILSRLVAGGLEYKNNNYQLIASLLLISVLIKELPQPGNLMFGNMQQYRYSITYGLRNDLRNDSKLIVDNIDAGSGNLLIIAQPENNKWDVFSAIAWIKYEILPIESVGIILADEVNYYDGFRSIRMTQEKFLKYVIKMDIEYIYLYSIDKYFEDNFGSLFEPWGDSTGKLLFESKITKDYSFALVE